MTEAAAPSPDALLAAARQDGRGRLKIFLGAAPGVGKTFEMLREGAERLRDGTDVVVAVVETHGRAETAALVDPFEIVSKRALDYRGHRLEEMDLDAVLARAPSLALVDEYAHTNVEGSRHPKRWQDVAELLDAGIDVYTTLNVQHLESLNDVVASFTRVRVRETVPDSAFEGAEVEVVDLPPDELIARLRDGKVYVPEEASRALGHFFSKPNLSALREMALRRAAQSVDRAMREHLDAHAVAGTYAGAERVLVAVSELAGSDTLVRAAKRLADALHADWTAVFIETPRAESFGDDDRRRIADALALAASLGASIATLPAESVIAGLTAQIIAMRATQLVIGKSRRSWWFELRHRSVVAAMLESGGGLAVHVIPAGDTTPRRPTRRKPPKPAPYSIGLAMVAAATGVAWAIEPYLGTGALDLVYLVPVLIAASRLGLRPGLFTGLAAALAYNFFFLPPIHTFTVADPRSVVTLLVLLGVGAFTSHLAGGLRSRAAIGVRGARENAAVAAFGQALARVGDAEATAQITCDHVARLLAVDTVLLAHRDGRLEPVAGTPADPTIGPVDQAAAEWTAARGEPAGSGTATLNAADWQFHPLQTAMGVLAVLGIARHDGRDPLPPDRALLLTTLTGQAALAQERLRLEVNAKALSVLQERDRLRAALLSSIGHDLRTPLTSVIAAIDAMGPGPHVAAARAEVQRLKRFLDNLLQMVRIDTAALTPEMEATDLTDAVAAAVRDLRDTLKHNRIDFDVPATLPLVRADPRLLHHILINLLANAAQHGGAGTPIRLIGRRERDAVTLAIADAGPGLGDKAGDIFKSFVRGTGTDRSGGSGLGLAIVKGFADAMKVEVMALTSPEGGAQLTLRFSDLA
ncbi:sensor histidine kinase KdpD [Roseomonas aeriglobus]|nr:sensor histidine kinase KdpD [Roseomonas aeriglobus]